MDRCERATKTVRTTNDSTTTLFESGAAQMVSFAQSAGNERETHRDSPGCFQVSITRGLFDRAFAPTITGSQCTKRAGKFRHIRPNGNESRAEFDVTAVQ